MINSFCCFQLIPRYRKDGENTHLPRYLLAWTSITISFTHALQSAIDQGIMYILFYFFFFHFFFQIIFFFNYHFDRNLFFGEIHQIGRDLGFAIGDLGVLLCTLFHVRRMYKREEVQKTVIKEHIFNSFKAWVGLFILYQLALQVSIT